MNDYEDYMTNQPMRDGEEIRSFFDDEEGDEEGTEDLMTWETNVFRRMQDGYVNRIIETLK